MTDASPHATTDLSDDHPEAQVCDPVFQAFGGRPAFSGPITTLKVFEDNALVRAAVEHPGQGRVLLVDGGGSLRCALFGATSPSSPRRTAGPAWSSTARCATRTSS